MPHIHTDLPKHKGELELAKTLRSIECDELHLWFAMDYIPGVRDVDVFIVAPSIGAFVVEVKAIPIGLIEEIGYTKWKIAGRDPDAGPVRQAYSASFGLREYLATRVSRPPFIVSTACFPRIERRSWNEAFAETEFCGDFAERLLFSEDFAFGAEVLRSRLDHIYRHPPVRAGARLDGAYPHPPRFVSPSTIESLNLALNPSAKPRPTPTDLERLQVIEKGVSSKTLKDYPPDDVNYGIFTGHPGTGKTFRLMHLLLSHAYGGKKVLFCCYNKTLGADIRRLLSFSEKLKHVHEYPLVLDVFQLAISDYHSNALTYSQNGHDEWLSYVVSEVKTNRDRGVVDSFDMIAVDEAQELNQSERELILFHLKEGGSIFFAFGQGQEIYRDRQKFSLQDAKTIFSGLDFTVSPKAKNLRRNFRNPEGVYFAAHLFHVCFPDPESIGDAYRSLLSKAKNGQLGFDFGRTVGGAVEIYAIDDDSLPHPDDPYFIDAKEELMVDRYFGFVTKEYEALTEKDSPLDLLVLVPTEQSSSSRWARIALERFEAEKNVGFSDMTAERNRRIVPENGKIRLCTFHSSRGLEANRVLIFGFEQIDQLAQKMGFSANNLGFIILSRSLFSTTVVFSRIATPSKHVLEKIVRELHSAGA